MEKKFKPSEKLNNSIERSHYHAARVYLQKNGKSNFKNKKQFILDSHEHLKGELKIGLDFISPSSRKKYEAEIDEFTLNRSEYIIDLAEKDFDNLNPASHDVDREWKVRS